MQLETTSTPGGYCTLAVSGEVDVATCVELREAGEKLVQETGCTGLRIDLSSVEFIDSSGIGALIAIRNAADSAAVPVVFANPSAKVSSVLEITRLNEVFTIEIDGTRS
jgi:anti-sigma B factor antagonist